MLGLDPVDRASDVPAFRQIATGLRTSIGTGNLAAGDRVPSEAQLMAHFGVARMTVRQALAELRTEGLVVAEHGRGVFVRAHPVVRRVASDRFARRHRDAGMAAFTAESVDIGTPSVDQLEVGHEQGPAEVRDALNIEGKGTVLARRRRYLLDGHPVELADTFIPSTLAAGTPIEDANTGPGGVYARLEEAGHRLGEFVENVGARMPTPEERRRLLLPSGTPVLTVRRIAYDTTGTPVETTHTVKAAPSFDLEYRFPAS